MIPYYDDGMVRLFHADMVEVDEWWRTGGALISDVPYGMQYVSNSALAGPSRPIDGDNDTSLRELALTMWFASTGWGNRPALIFGTWRVKRPEGVKQLLVWDKGDSPGMGDLKTPWGPAHEDIYVFGEGFKGKRVPNVIRVPTIPPSSKDRPNHPTAKPLSLMVHLIQYCPPDWVIVDPFAGSGTTLVAAKQLGRKAIGVEIDESYCELAAQRLSQGVLVLT